MKCGDRALKSSRSGPKLPENHIAIRRGRAADDGWEVAGGKAGCGPYSRRGRAGRVDPEVTAGD